MKASAPLGVAKMLWVMVLGMGLAMGLTGCAAKPKANPGDPTLPEIDVLRLKDDANEALKLAHENKLDIQSLQTKVQELENRLALIAGQLSEFSSAQVGDIQSKVGKLEEDLKTLQQRKEAAALAPPPPPPAPVATFKPKAEKGDSAGAPKEKGTKEVKAIAEEPKTEKSEKAAPPPKATGKVGPKPHTSPDEANLYKQAFDHYYSRQYAQAINKFTQIIQKFPEGHYVDDSHYWVGECHFAMGNFAKAITSFRTIFSFEGTEKADDAQLKLGYSYLRLGDKRRASEEFQKVISLYPDSEFTERAQEELDQLR